MTFEQRLINLVKQYDLLYNTNHPSFTKVPERTAAWKEIAEKLDSNRHHCKKKWKSLRDTYKKLLIKIEAAGGVYKYHRRKWQYMELISFVNKYEPLFQKHYGKKWPTFVDTSQVNNEHILLKQESMEYTENAEDEEEFVIPEDEEQIDDTCLREELIDTEESDPYCIQEEYLTEEDACSSPVTELEGVKVIEITHSYAKTTNEANKSPEYSTKNTEEYFEDSPREFMEDCNVSFKSLKDPSVIAAITGPCSYYLAQLGAQIDALPVPSAIQINLEKRIKDLVDEVVEEYSRQQHAGIES